MPTRGQKALAEAARREAALVYGTTCHEHRAFVPAAREPDIFPERLPDSYYGPAPAADILQLVAVTTSGRMTRADIQLVECAIANGWSDDRIREELDVTDEQLAQVRGVMAEGIAS